MSDSSGADVTVLADWVATRQEASASVRATADLVADSRRDAGMPDVRGVGDQHMLRLVFRVAGADIAADATGGRGEAVIDIVLDAERLTRHTVRLTGQILCSHAAPSSFALKKSARGGP